MSDRGILIVVFIIVSAVLGTCAGSGVGVIAIIEAMNYQEATIETGFKTVIDHNAKESEENSINKVVVDLSSNHIEGQKRVIERLAEAIRKQASLVEDLRVAVHDSHDINIEKQKENASLNDVIEQAAKRILELTEELDKMKGY